MLRKFFNRLPELKSAREIGMMREAGKLVSRALKICRQLAQPGARTLDIDRAVDSFFAEHKATPLFKGYPGRTPFPASTCISVNEQVVHGIPGQRVLREGDLLKIDTACKLNGWCADAAVTLPIGGIRPECQRLLDTAQQVLHMAMVELTRRRWWSEVASCMQQHAENAGYSVVTQYVGHGIGRIMHENPQVPNFTNREVRKHDFRLEDGLVLAIEPMVNMGKPEVYTLRDHWTVVTKDGLPSVHVEHTVALTREGVFIVTGDEDATPEQLLIPRPT